VVPVVPPPLVVPGSGPVLPGVDVDSGSPVDVLGAAVVDPALVAAPPVGAPVVAGAAVPPSPPSPASAGPSVFGDIDSPV
jgi:hypothetical protein